MGKEAFYFCGLESLELPDTVEVLDEKAFFKCMYLTEIKLPESIRRIEKWVECIWKKGRSRNEVSDEFYNITG